MSIRLKIILIVLPLLIATLLLSGIASSSSARNGITRIAIRFLGFKATELDKYANSQWNLLVENNLDERREYVKAAEAAVMSYARTLVHSDTELIFALDAEGNKVMETGAADITENEKSDLVQLIREGKTSWVEFQIGGKDRVGHTFFFEPFSWSFFVTEEKGTFYREVAEITRQSAIILAVACILSLVLLLIFSGYLTRPLIRVVTTMKGIIGSYDLSKRVTVEYKDEIGSLAHTFNIMTAELEKAYAQIKNFAFKAVLARKHEQEIRNIFQKYVPKEVIDKCFQNPESMLIGDNRVLAVLFSDIRQFTTISEGLPPDELVNSLNRYFSIMVDIIMKRRGIVDKYIGDAIMAFFGAPVSHEDDALQAVLSGLEMNDGLKLFNQEQTKKSKPHFRIGIGINYGPVTVGNIGSEMKMDYTVIGDMVNLASRLEGLTKTYHQELIFSESVYEKVKNRLPCRMLDKVVVRGKTQGERIFTTRKKIDQKESQGWAYHHVGMKSYYQRNFQRADSHFQAVLQLLPEDTIASIFSHRCKKYLETPPPPDWKGIEIVSEK